MYMIGTIYKKSTPMNKIVFLFKNSLFVFSYKNIQSTKR